QFTANTMATAFEMLGVSPMGSNDVPAMDPRKEEIAFETGKLVMDLLNKGVRPRQLITKRALQNAIAGVMATGGSTNAVLHLLAVAKEAGVKLTIDEFDPVSRRTPLLADLKPWGSYTAPEMYAAGGMAVAAKRLLGAGRLDATEMTVTGRASRDGCWAGAGARAGRPAGSRPRVKRRAHDRRALLGRHARRHGRARRARGRRRRADRRREERRHDRARRQAAAVGRRAVRGRDQEAAARGEASEATLHVGRDGEVRAPRLLGVGWRSHRVRPPRG